MYMKGSAVTIPITAYQAIQVEVTLSYSVYVPSLVIFTSNFLN